MKKNIIIGVVLVIFLFVALYMGLASYMHYTIEKDININEVKIKKIEKNDKEVSMNDLDDKALMDAISSATFKREFSDAKFSDDTYSVYIENESDKGSIVFKFDLKGNGEVLNDKTGKITPIELKKKLLEKLNIITRK